MRSLALEAVSAALRCSRSSSRARTRTRSTPCRRVARRGPDPRCRRGQPVCVVETTKATVEVEAPGPERSCSSTRRTSRSSSARRSRTSRRQQTSSRRSMREPRRSPRRSWRPGSQGDAKSRRARRAPWHRSCVDRQARFHHREGRRGADRPAQGAGDACRQSDPRGCLDGGRLVAIDVRGRRVRRRARPRISRSSRPRGVPGARARQTR